LITPELNQTVDSLLMSLTTEQLQGLDDLLSRFNALQESLPHQLERLNEAISNLDSRISSLQHSVEQDFHTSRNDTNIEIGNLRSEIYQFLTVNVPTKTDLQNATHVTNQPVATPKHVKIKPPPLFSGKLSACEPFFAYLSIVFSADRTRFANDETKILFAISYLIGNAFGYIEPYLPDIDATENKPEILTNYNTFKNALVTAFGDSNPVISAESSLRNLKQTSSAAAYATDFRRLSRRMGWNECALVSQFMLNLKDSVKDELSRREPITDFNTLVNTSIDIDNRLFSRHRQKNASHRDQYPSTHTQSTPALEIRPSIVNMSYN
jgi:hypothetical protein